MNLMFNTLYYKVYIDKHSFSREINQTLTQVHNIETMIYR